MHVPLPGERNCLGLVSTQHLFSSSEWGWSLLFLSRSSQESRIPGEAEFTLPESPSVSSRISLKRNNKDYHGSSQESRIPGESEFTLPVSPSIYVIQNKPEERMVNGYSLHRRAESHERLSSQFLCHPLCRLELYIWPKMEQRGRIQPRMSSQGRRIRREAEFTLPVPSRINLIDNRKGLHQVF